MNSPLQSSESKNFTEKHTLRDTNVMAEEARRHAEVARLVTYQFLENTNKLISEKTNSSFSYLAD